MCIVLYPNIVPLVQSIVCSSSSSSSSSSSRSSNSSSTNTTLFRRISPVSQDRFEVSFSLLLFLADNFGNLCLPLFSVKYVSINRMCRSITIF